MRLSGVITVALACGCAPAPVSSPPLKNAGPPAADGGSVRLDAGLIDVGGSDAALADAGASPDSGLAPDAGADLPITYAADRTHSPLTQDVVDNLRGIAAANPALDDHVFAKVGDSVTKSRNFLHCFAGPHVDVDGRDGLLTTVEHFRAGDAAGSTPFDRESETVVVGWSARSAIAGDPSPVERELAAISPRFAVVMYGTNDLESGNVYTYGENMLDLVDLLIAAGTIPVLSSIMPRDDRASADEDVPRYNGVVRAIARARKLPFIDYHRALLPLPDHGVGADGVHPTVHRTTGGARGCILSDEGLSHGYNLRNLLTLEALHRLRSALFEGAAPPDRGRVEAVGEGTAAAPIEIGALPFTDRRDTTIDGASAIDAYPGCNAAQDESGNEVIYRLVLAQPTSVRAMVLDRGDVDIDVHLLGSTVDPNTCVDRNHRVIVADLAAGTHHFALDTFVGAGGGAMAGEYLFVVLQE